MFTKMNLEGLNENPRIYKIIKGYNRYISIKSPSSWVGALGYLYSFFVYRTIISDIIFLRKQVSVSGKKSAGIIP